MNFRSFVSVLALVAVFGSNAFAAGSSSTSLSSHSDVNVQPEGTKGIGFSFPNGGGGTINGSYFLAKDRAARVDLGFDLTSVSRTSVGFGFSVDAGYRMYCHKVGSLATFFQPSLFLALPVGGSVVFGPSGAIGAEYFFSSNLSFGVSAGANFTFQEGFKSVRFNTGTTAISGTLYL